MLAVNRVWHRVTTPYPMPETQALGGCVPRHLAPVRVCRATRKVRRSPLRWVSGRRCPARRRRRGWRGGKTSRVRAQRSRGVVREDHSGSASKRRIVRMFMWTRHTSKGWRPKTEACCTSGRLVETLPPPLPRSMNVPRTHLPGGGWIAASRGRPAPWDSKAAYKEPKPVGCHGRRGGRCMLTARRSADHPLRHDPLDVSVHSACTTSRPIVSKSASLRRRLSVAMLTTPSSWMRWAASVALATATSGCRSVLAWRSGLTPPRTPP